MNSREAKRVACSAVAWMILGELDAGFADRVTEGAGLDSLEDAKRVDAALRELANELHRRGVRQEEEE